MLVDKHDSHSRQSQTSDTSDRMRQTWMSAQSWDMREMQRTQPHSLTHTDIDAYRDIDRCRHRVYVRDIDYAIDYDIDTCRDIDRCRHID